MCGRTVLCLQPDQVVGACAYRKRDSGKYSKPKWREGECCGRQYKPSTNIAPTDVTPVLVKMDGEICLRPMMWGMVPPWHRGSYKTHRLSTNNCRSETMLTSKLFGGALRKGARCVVVAQGFYEWQTVDGTKQPYFIFAPQRDGLKMFDPDTQNNTFSEDDGWQGVQLLKMAGLYNEWKGDEGELGSYSVITMESNDTMQWIHHRMPAIFETDEQIEKWLDVENTTLKDALECLRKATKLDSYPVSDAVNNSRNKSESCMNPIDPNDTKTSPKKSPKKRKAESGGSKSVMMSWLKKGKKD